jgi:integrase
VATFRKVGKRWRAEVRRLGTYRSKTFARKLDAQEWAAATERELEHGNGQIRERPTLRQVCEDYARDVAPTKRGARWEQIRLEHFCRDPVADLEVGRVTPERLGQWRDQRLRSVSAGTVLRDLTLLSAVFEWARRERRLIDANPVRDTRKPPSPKPRTRLPTDDEIDRLCLALGYEELCPVQTKSAQVAAALLIAIETAMRSGEICDLAWDRVDTARRVVTLEKTKSGNARQVPLTTKAVTILEQLRGIDPVRVFTVDSATRDVLFRRARDACEIVGLTFHDSRALALTRLSKVLDPYQLARVAGHSSLDQILVYYRETAEDIAQKLS